MTLSQLHLLLTYRCTFECDHCFVWGSPWQRGVMSLQTVRSCLAEAKDCGTIEWIYFEGGEPFLYYAVLRRGVEEAARLGFRVGIVSNAYWATEVEDAIEWLRPFTGIVEDLPISLDDYHGAEELRRLTSNARTAAALLGIPTDNICVAQPDAEAAAAKGTLPPGECALMYRGRAASKLAERAQPQAPSALTTCPFENLRDPGRVHVDPFGHLHICQGIRIGNLLYRPLRDICAEYRPEDHPITGPLVDGGPAALAAQYGIPHRDSYADACHWCGETRAALRERFPLELGPDAMYGVAE